MANSIISVTFAGFVVLDVCSNFIHLIYGEINMLKYNLPKTKLAQKRTNRTRTSEFWRLRILFIPSVQKLSWIFCIRKQQVRNAKTNHSLDLSNKNTYSQAAKEQAVEHETAARKTPGSSQGHYLPWVKI